MNFSSVNSQHRHEECLKAVLATLNEQCPLGHCPLSPWIPHQPCVQESAVLLYPDVLLPLLNMNGCMDMPLLPNASILGSILLDPDRHHVDHDVCVCV
eukprot:1160164-Pelagomonas_calceolata.AAC.1